MKRYTVTEKQLEQLKKLLEKIEELPEHICERFYADYVEPIDGVVSEYQYQNTKTNALGESTEPLRDLKFLVEDIEGQEVSENA